MKLLLLPAVLLVLACGSSTPGGGTGQATAASTGAAGGQGGSSGVTCNTKPSYSLLGSCGFTWDACSDGLTYGGGCTKGMCQCSITQKDGTTSKGVMTTTDLCSLANNHDVQAIDMICGWTVQSK
jgi:hypothetical protein